MPNRGHVLKRFTFGTISLKIRLSFQIYLLSLSLCLNTLASVSVFQFQEILTRNLKLYYSCHILLFKLLSKYCNRTYMYIINFVMVKKYIYIDVLYLYTVYCLYGLGFCDNATVE